MLPPRIRRRVMQNGSEPMLTKPSGSGMCLVSCGNKFRLTKSIRRCFSSWKDALDLYMRQRLLGRLQALRSCLQEHLGMEMKQLDLPSDDDKNIVRISSQSSMQAGQPRLGEANATVINLFGCGGLVWWMLFYQQAQRCF
ncbi:unnamed protein product [Effrenium voratum]|nr:unnamed protein product [Effrenium voratum]